MKPIYLDYNATTPVDPAVAEEMLPYLFQHFGNPSSSHLYGKETRSAIETARARVAAILGCAPPEIIFTSGASESNNTVLKGVAFAQRSRGNHIIVSRVEHPSVLQPCRFLEQEGFSVTYLPVDITGRIDPEDVRRAITPETILISIMHANNEVGTIQPVTEVSRLAKARNILFHTDAAQSVGKISTLVDELGADFLSVAGHKIYAPKGIGALYVRTGVSFEPLIHGAGHERGRRSGTENVAYIVALGKACELARDDLPRYQSEIADLRGWFQRELTRLGDRIQINGHPTNRLPNTLHVSFLGVTGGDLLAKIPDLAASTGAACHDGKFSVSSVLQAMNVSAEAAMGAVRFSLGKDTSPEDLRRALDMITQAMKGL